MYESSGLPSIFSNLKTNSCGPSWIYFERKFEHTSALNLKRAFSKAVCMLFQNASLIFSLQASICMQVKLLLRAFELKLPTFRSSMFLFLKWLAAAKSFWLVLLAKKLQHWKVCIEMSCGDEKRNINKLVETETWSDLGSWIQEQELLRFDLYRTKWKLNNHEIGRNLKQPNNMFVRLSI